MPLPPNPPSSLFPAQVVPHPPGPLTHRSTPPYPSSERSWGGTDYIVNLRATLDAAGHTHTKIVLPDCAVAGDPTLLAAIATNATFGAAFSVAGLHGNPVPVPILEATAHKYWQSETGFAPISLESDWRGAQDWARNLARNYVTSNITGTITWSTLWSVLPGLPYDGRGLMMANTPWSGSYNVSAPVWVSAQWGQFLEVGWRHLLTGRGAGLLPAGADVGGSADAGGAADAGSYVAFVPPDSLSQLTLIVETINAPPSTRVFSLVGGLPGPGASFCVWTTTNSARFVRGSDVLVASDGTLTLTLPGDGVLTASTVCTAAHGVPSTPVPPPAPFALPYHDAFDEADCAYDSLPRYLSDQGGSFACRNGSLAQVVTQRPGSNDWYVTPDPLTLLGDYTPWADVTIGVTVALPPSVASSRQQVRSGDDPNAAVAPCEAGPSPIADAQAWSFNVPAQGYLSNAVDGESICVNLYGCEPRLIYYECCTSCGCYNGAGFVFSLQPNASLTAPLLPGLCASVLPDNATVSMVPCSASALQQWALVPGTRQLVNAGTRTCLTSPLRPIVPYTRVCARVTAYSGFNGLAPVPAYCLVLRSDSSWAVTAANVTLANGTLAGYDPARPTALELALAGDAVSASVGGVALGSWPGRGAFAAGMVALGSGVHEAVFDDFFVR